MGKEAMRRFREKKRANTEEWIIWKEKERQRIKQYRESVKNRASQQKQPKRQTTKEEKKKNTERQRQYRANRRYISEHPEARGIPYKTKQSLYKAVNRVRKVLPENIDRKRMVLKQLLDEFYPEASAEINRKVNETKKEFMERKTRKALDAQVIEFYQRQDITYQTPGKSDVISVKTDNKRIIMQKQYMTMTLGEAYQIYCEEIGNGEKVGKSKFFELRPPNVMVVAETPHNVCVCQLHSNFNYLCSSLKSINGFPSNYKSLLDELCCNLSSESCMMGQCDQCQENVTDVLPLLFDYDANIFWKKWEKNKENSRVQIKRYRSTVARAVEEIQIQMPKFKKHVHINIIQSAHFKAMKETLRTDEIVIQIDFAENFAIISQDEIQAAHFSYDQVTVFTVCLWKEHQTQSLAIISNDLDHDKYSVWTFLKSILDYLTTEPATFKKCHIFPMDAPPSSKINASCQV